MGLQLHKLVQQPWPCDSGEASVYEDNVEYHRPSKIGYNFSLFILTSKLPETTK